MGSTQKDTLQVDLLQNSYSSHRLNKGQRESHSKTTGWRRSQKWALKGRETPATTKGFQPEPRGTADWKTGRRTQNGPTASQFRYKSRPRNGRLHLSPYPHRAHIYTHYTVIMTRNVSVLRAVFSPVFAHPPRVGPAAAEARVYGDRPRCLTCCPHPWLCQPVTKCNCIAVSAFSNHKEPGRSVDLPARFREGMHLDQSQHFV